MEIENLNWDSHLRKSLEMALAISVIDEDDLNQLRTHYPEIDTASVYVATHPERIRVEAEFYTKEHERIQAENYQFLIQYTENSIKKLLKEFDLDQFFHITLVPLKEKGVLRFHLIRA